MVGNIKKYFILLFCIIAVSLAGISAGGTTAALKNIELPKEAVSKKILENGLTVLTKESQPSGLVTIDIKIKAGSSLEGEYLGSGISHLVEHMIFKGTRARKPGDIEKEVKSYGGVINGSVSQDLTDYYLTVPSKYLKEALAILKDMLLNAVFDPSELENEKGVILKEIKLHDDEPQSRLLRLLNETAYLQHPYRYPPIGYESRFKLLTRPDAIKYYNRMYVPNRMVIAIVGGIDRSDAISKVENEFKDFRRPGYSDIGPLPTEPPQIERRQLDEEGHASLGYLGMAFHSTRLLDTDLFAMDVLAMILGRGDNSRLNKELLKSKKAVYSISCWNYTPRDPGVFIINAVLDKNNLNEAESLIMEEIRKLKDAQVGDDELEAAKRMVLSDFIFSLQTIGEQAGELSSNYIMTGSHDFYKRYVEGIQAVSKNDVKSAAEKYLSGDNLTIVRLLPQIPKPAESRPVAQSMSKEDIKKETLPNGLRLLVREDKKTPTVAITVAMLGGLMVEEKADNGISHLASEMLLKGTAKRDESKIAGAVEALGGDISAFSAFNSFGLNMELLNADAVTGVEILRDVLGDSVFPAEELDKEKTLTLAMIKEEDDDIFQRGLNVLRKEIFGDSPYGLRSLGEEGTVKALKRDDIVNFYNKYVIPNNMVISVSGDVDAGSFMNILTDAFKDLKAKKDVTAISAKRAKIGSVKAAYLTMDKAQSLLLAGFETVDLKSPDRYALDVLGSILSGQSGRLFDALRGKQSLAYTLGCAQRLGLDTGFLVLYVATSKDKLSQSKKGLLNQIKDIRARKVDDAELIAAKRELCTDYQLGTQTNIFFSSTTALDELYGRGYDNLYKYESEINKVTKDDVKRVADKYLNLNAYAEVVVSPN